MYSIYNTEAAIKEIQRLLGINRTGIYDNATRESVIEIQKLNGLNTTGKTDYNTFTAIVDNYRTLRMGKENYYLTNESYPYVYEDMDDNVALINKAIELVLRNYTYEGVLPKGNFFDKNTVDGVRFLRTIFMLAGKDEVDAPLMNRILLELGAIEIKTNIK